MSRQNVTPDQFPELPKKKQQTVQTANTAPRRRKKIDPVKRKHQKINRSMIMMLLITSAVVIVLFGVNIYKVAAGSGTSAGTGTTLTTDTSSTQKNNLYTIGNNPTDIEQTYFKELTTAVNSDDRAAMATAVVKNFIVDYFTWTNKDGNYEVGGQQYIYSQKTSAFETFSRWNFYEDLDLYISQYGRDNLLQVKEVTATDALFTNDFAINSVDPAVTLTCYYVEASWTYENCKLDTSSFQNTGYFYVVDNDGRLEIAEFYGED
ncbi:MAG: hypothetical protein LKF50_06335 [Solobacterium sp.]|jgi:hypothetical protein|nr:hypothetical protein [Solobacterium sp.]